MKNGPFLPSYSIFINTKESDEYLSELRKQVFTFWREQFGCGFKKAMDFYDTHVSRLKEDELPSFYALDSHFCETTQTPVVTIIHVIDKTKPLTQDNLTLIRQIVRRV